MIFGSELDVMGIISLGMSPAVWWFHMIFVCVRVCSEMDRNGIYMEEQMGKTSTNIDQQYDIRIVLKNWVTPSKWPQTLYFLLGYFILRQTQFFDSTCLRFEEGKSP